MIAEHRPDVVQLVGRADLQHPPVGGGIREVLKVALLAHAPRRFGLALAVGTGHDDIGNGPSELALDVGRGDGAVLDRVMEQRGDDRVVVTSVFHDERGDREEVGQVRDLARLADLTLVGARREREPGHDPLGVHAPSFARECTNFLPGASPASSASTPGEVMSAIRTRADAHALARRLVTSATRTPSIAILDANHRILRVERGLAATAAIESWHRVLVATTRSDEPVVALPGLLDWLVVDPPTAGKVTSALGASSAWPPPDPGAEVEAGRFEQLLTALEDDGLLDPTVHRSALLRIVGDPDDSSTWEAGIRDLDDLAARDALLGFVAPEEWIALGVVTGGWAGSPGNTTPGDVARGRFTRRPSADPDARRIAFATVVGRRGGEASRLQIAGQPAFTPTGASEGIVGDAIRRALALPTAPPAVPTDEVFAVWWLENILDAIEDRGGRRPSWREVGEHHPGLQLLAAGGDRVRSDELLAVAGAVGRAIGWKELQESEARTDELVRWMDAGMYARWELGGRAPLAELLAAVHRRLAPAVARRIRAVLRELDVLPERPGSLPNTQVS